MLNLDCVGEGMPLAIRAAKAGHKVQIWMSKDNHKETGDGFRGVEKVDNWLTAARTADLIVPTGNHQYIEKLDMLRKAGKNVFGPSTKSAALEIQRADGMKFFEDHGIECPPWKQFPTLQTAEAHVRKTGERFVFKTLGDSDDKSLSYVGKSAADMIARLQRWERLKMAGKGPFMLQKVIDGVEFAVSRWMGTDGFVGEPNENFEFKKLLSGNCGPNCGESGTLMKYTADSKLFDQVLAPLEDALVDMGHLGDIDVNCIVDEKGKAWPLEFTTRLGWPAANIMWASHKGDPVEWMLDACDGKDTLLTSPAVACGIVLAQPDYPNSKFTKAEVADIPMYGVTKENAKYLSPQCVKIDTMPDMQGDTVVERDIWCTTGDYLAVATGMGKTVKKACERAYSTVKEIHVPNMMYRDDVGESLEKSIPELQKHGFATDWTYS